MPSGAGRLARLSAPCGRRRTWSTPRLSRRSCERRSLRQHRAPPPPGPALRGSLRPFLIFVRDLRARLSAGYVALVPVILTHAVTQDRHGWLTVDHEGRRLSCYLRHWVSTRSLHSSQHSGPLELMQGRASSVCRSESMRRLFDFPPGRLHAFSRRRSLIVVLVVATSAPQESSERPWTLPRADKICEKPKLPETCSGCPRLPLRHALGLCRAFALGPCRVFAR